MVVVQSVAPPPNMRVRGLELSSHLKHIYITHELTASAWSVVHKKKGLNVSNSANHLTCCKVFRQHASVPRRRLAGADGRPTSAGHSILPGALGSH